MDSLYILIPIALIFVGIAVKIFLWAVDSEQFDNLDVEAQRILFDDVSADTESKQPGSAADPDSSASAKEQQQPRE